MNLLPVALHVNHGPATDGCLIETFVEPSDGRLAVVCELALSIGVMHNQAEPSTRSGCRPFQHLKVAIGIAERHRGAATKMLLNADRLAFFVINEIQFRKPNQNGLPIAHFVFRFDAAANNLLGRNTVNSFAPRTHEFDATTRNNKGLKPVRSQIDQHFQHRLIDHYATVLAETEWPPLQKISDGRIRNDRTRTNANA